MALASIPATPTEGSTSPMDAYLLDVYRQAAESARPSGRFSSPGAFLTIVGLLTAALVVLFSVLEGSSDAIRPAACVALGAIGLVVSTAFYVMDLHRRHASREEAPFDQAIYATSSIYQASIAFFGFAVAISAALLLVR
jgi:hypothetical protein